MEKSSENFFCGVPGSRKLSDLVSRVGVVTVRQLIPEGLAQIAPGPQLSAVLAGLDIHALTESDLVEGCRRGPISFPTTRLSSWR